jgi:hypothetical protein
VTLIPVRPKSSSHHRRGRRDRSGRHLQEVGLGVARVRFDDVRPGPAFGNVRRQADHLEVDVSVVPLGEHLVTRTDQLETFDQGSDRVVSEERELRRFSHGGVQHEAPGDGAAAVVGDLPPVDLDREIGSASRVESLDDVAKNVLQFEIRRKQRRIDVQFPFENCVSDTSGLFRQRVQQICSHYRRIIDRGDFGLHLLHFLQSFVDLLVGFHARGYYHDDVISRTVRLGPVVQHRHRLFDRTIQTSRLEMLGGGVRNLRVKHVSIVSVSVLVVVDRDDIDHFLGGTLPRQNQTDFGVAREYVPRPISQHQSEITPRLSLHHVFGVLKNKNVARQVLFLVADFDRRVYQLVAVDVVDAITRHEILMLDDNIENASSLTDRIVLGRCESIVIAVVAKHGHLRSFRGEHDGTASPRVHHLGGVVLGFGIGSADPATTRASVTPANLFSLSSLTRCRLSEDPNTLWPSAVWSGRRRSTWGRWGRCGSLVRRRRRTGTWRTP